MKVNIRSAKPEDSHKVAQVHFNSVRETGAKFYSSDICNDWSPEVTDSRAQIFFDAISSGEEVMFVAEIAGEIVGFSSIVPKNCELRAVYVDPRFGSIGIGKILLEKIESEARHRGIDRLFMNASLSAEDFYRSRGYIETERVEHSLRSGKLMKAIKMEKTLR